jgi:hypothetical protein
MRVRFRSIESFVAVLLCGVFAAAGCGPAVKVPTAPVSGIITVSGKPIEGVEVVFVPQAKIRPGIGITDASGRYEARFLERQGGVPLGRCEVRISLYRGEARDNNLIPPQYNDLAFENPALNLTIPKEGTTFNFDVKTTKPIP